MTCLDIENVIFNTFDVKESEYKQIYNVCFKGARLHNVSFAQCQLVRCNFDKWELTLKEQEKLSLELEINAGQKRETYLEEVDFSFVDLKHVVLEKQILRSQILDILSLLIVRWVEVVLDWGISTWQHSVVPRILPIVYGRIAV